MKVEMTPTLHPQRGGEVKEGNVYSNAHGRFYKIVVGLKGNGRGYRNVVCIHVDIMGDVVGCSTNPATYISEHQDLVGVIKEMPNLKIEWLRASTAKKTK